MDKETQIKEIFGKLASVGKITGFTDYKHLPYKVEFCVCGKKLTFVQKFNVDYNKIISCELSLERGWTSTDLNQISEFLRESKVI
jgi:hypothetical protein